MVIIVSLLVINFLSLQSSAAVAAANESNSGNDAANEKLFSTLTYSFNSFAPRFSVGLIVASGAIWRPFAGTFRELQKVIELVPVSQFVR